jgi:hypothetical protein
MKTATIMHLAIGLFIAPLFVSCLVLPPKEARAQGSGYPEPFEAYSREELAQMLAPVALYPDVLLSQILMASTYPIEVIEADRWIGRNPGLKDAALDAALLAEDWDPSVKAICHYPSILGLMSERISETTEIGNAFLAQEAEVMDMVQELRARAYAQGNLATDSRQKVVVQKETIIIEPAAPRVIYVPYYDPFVIYGPWWYPAYPPWYWGPPGVSIGFGISYWSAFHFSFTYGTWSYFDWPRRTIFIDVHKRPRFVRHDRWIVKPGRWHHAPVHRRGVVYRDSFTARKYGQDPHRFRDYRRDVRGFPDRRDPHRDGDRRVDDRSRIDRDKRGDDRLRLERDRQVQQRVIRERQTREQAERQKRQTIDRNRQMRKNVDRDRPQQVKQKQVKQEQVKLESVRKEGERGERGRQMRQQTEQEKQGGDRVERQQRQRSRDNVSNRVEDAKRERPSNERGPVNRQNRNDDFRGKGLFGGDDKGGRDDRKGNGR